MNETCCASGTRWEDFLLSRRIVAEQEIKRSLTVALKVHEDHFIEQTGRLVKVGIHAFLRTVFNWISNPFSSCMDELL